MQLSLGSRLGARRSTGEIGVWVIVGTSIQQAPTPFAAATPVIADGILQGPYGIYRVVNSTVGTDIERNLTPPTSLSSFSSPGDSLTIYHLRFSSQSPEVLLASGFTATETWSSYANGNTFTQLDTNYARTNGVLTTSIATDTDGPAGLACIFSTAGVGAVCAQLHRDDITAQLATRLVTDRVNVLAKIKTLNLNSRAGIGWQDGGQLFTGMTVSNTGGGNLNQYSLMTEGNLNNNTPKTDILTGRASGLVFWIRFEVQGADIRGKAWADGAGEPGTWAQTRTHTGNLTFDKFGLVGRGGVAASASCLGYSIGIKADAPSF
jgi:hypothetical protein